MIRVSGMSLLNDSKVITHCGMTSTCQTQDVGPDHIMGRLKAIRDARMRVLALITALGEGDPMEWVEVLASIITRAHSVDDADALETLECITPAAADTSLPYKTRQKLYEAALERNLASIARLFLVA